MLEQELILYAGSETQRRILEEYKEDKEQRNKELDGNWTFLKNRVFLKEDEGTTETYKYITAFREGKLSLKDIQPGLLGNYFKQYHTSRTFLNDFKKRNQFYNMIQDLIVKMVYLEPIIAFGH